MGRSQQHRSLLREVFGAEHNFVAEITLQAMSWVSTMANGAQKGSIPEARACSRVARLEVTAKAQSGRSNEKLRVKVPV
jgi:hypothetical protein